MIRFHFSRRALADLRGIGLYIAGDNPVRALTFVQELRAYCDSLRGFPLAGTARPDLGPRARIGVYGRYLVIYDVMPDLLIIRRGVHGARDLKRLF